MGRDRQYKKQKCFNPECINGGAPADLEDKKCFWEKDNLDKVFCSTECGQYYADNEDEIEAKSRLDQKIRKNKSRQRLVLVNAIHIFLNRKIEKELIAQMVERLALFSPYL